MLKNYELNLDLAFQNKDEIINALNKNFNNIKILNYDDEKYEWPNISFSFNAKSLYDAKKSLLKLFINDDDFIINDDNIDELMDEYYIDEFF